MDVATVSESPATNNLLVNRSICASSSWQHIPAVWRCLRGELNKLTAIFACAETREELLDVYLDTCGVPSEAG
jgi:hypothetical protein